MAAAGGIRRGGAAGRASFEAQPNGQAGADSEVPEVWRKAGGRKVRGEAFTLTSPLERHNLPASSYRNPPYRIERAQASVYVLRVQRGSTAPRSQAQRSAQERLALVPLQRVLGYLQGSERDGSGRIRRGYVRSCSDGLRKDPDGLERSPLRAFAQTEVALVRHTRGAPDRIRAALRSRTWRRLSQQQESQCRVRPLEGGDEVCRGGNRWGGGHPFSAQDETRRRWI